MKFSKLNNVLCLAVFFVFLNQDQLVAQKKSSAEPFFSINQVSMAGFQTVQYGIGFSYPISKKYAIRPYFKTLSDGYSFDLYNEVFAHNLTTYNNVEEYNQSLSRFYNDIRNLSLSNIGIALQREFIQNKRFTLSFMIGLEYHHIIMSDIIGGGTFGLSFQTMRPNGDFFYLNNEEITGLGMLGEFEILFKTSKYIDVAINAGTSSINYGRLSIINENPLFYGLKFIVKL